MGIWDSIMQSRAAQIAGDTLGGAWQDYQGVLPDFLTETYRPMPEADLSGMGGGGPWGDAQSMYDFLREMTALNPSIDILAALVGGLAGRLGGAGRMARGAGMVDEAADVGSYMGRPKMAGGGGQAALQPDLPLPNRGPTPGGPAGLQGAEAASGHPTMVPRNVGAADDFAAMNQPGMELGGGPMSQPGMQLGPDDFLNPDQYTRHLDEMAAGPQPMSQMATSAPGLDEFAQMFDDAIAAGMSPQDAESFVMQMYQQAMGGISP